MKSPERCSRHGRHDGRRAGPRWLRNVKRLSTMFRPCRQQGEKEPQRCLQPAELLPPRQVVFLLSHVKIPPEAVQDRFFVGVSGVLFFFFFLLMK